MAVQEWGVFTDEGAVEGSMWPRGEAERRARELRVVAVSECIDEEYIAAPFCEAHRDAEQREGHCYLCFEELDAEDPCGEAG